MYTEGGGTRWRFDLTEGNPPYMWPSREDTEGQISSGGYGEFRGRRRRVPLIRQLRGIVDLVKRDKEPLLYPHTLVSLAQPTASRVLSGDIQPQKRQKKQGRRNDSLFPKRMLCYLTDVDASFHAMQIPFLLRYLTHQKQLKESGIERRV